MLRVDSVKSWGGEEDVGRKSGDMTVGEEKRKKDTLAVEICGGEGEKC